MLMLGIVKDLNYTMPLRADYLLPIAMLIDYIIDKYV